MERKQLKKDQTAYTTKSGIVRGLDTSDYKVGDKYPKNTRKRFKLNETQRLLIPVALVVLTAFGLLILKLIRSEYDFWAV